MWGAPAKLWSLRALGALDDSTGGLHETVWLEKVADLASHALIDEKRDDDLPVIE